MMSNFKDIRQAIALTGGAARPSYLDALGRRVRVSRLTWSNEQRASVWLRK